MGAIVLTGIPSDYALPGNFIETNLGVGPVAGSDVSYPILLIGNKTSAGDATVDTVVYGPTSSLPLQTEQDCINRFGAGSELHRGFLRVTDPRKGAGNQTTAIYAIAVTESVGANATFVITYGGVAATAPGGSTRIWVGDEFVDVPIATGDTVTATALAAKLAINAKTQWPVTADVSAGVLTLTAKQKGLRGNWLRGQATISSGITMTSDKATIAYFTSGTTADSNTAALATLASARYYYNVSAAEDATQFGALATQVAAQALPAAGIRCRAFGASIDTQANAITIATGRNAARGECLNLPAADWTPFEIAAHAAGVYALLETKPKPRHNFSGYGNGPNENAIWKIPAPRSGVTQTNVALNTALKNGLTPIGVNPNGSTYIVKRCTTKCLSGANPDFRSRDAHKVTVTDFFADDWYAKLNAQFSGKDITDDPTQGQHVPGATVATPSSIRGALFQLITDYDNNDQIQHATTIKANTVVQRETSPLTRASCRVPLEVIDILDQTTTALDQVG